MIQQAFDRVGGEGIIPAHFDPEIGEIAIDFNTVLDDNKVKACTIYNSIQCKILTGKY